MAARAQRIAIEIALGVAALGALGGCPYQPVLDEPCPYDATVGNCFEAAYSFNFDDARVEAIDLASLPQAASACRDPVRGTVTRVVDGDTFDIMIDGATATERIRMIGVDTPETYVSMGYPHCYGTDAKLWTEELTGRRVALSFDRGCDDGNGRVLAFVWLGARENDLWQRQLLRRGYARELTIAPNDLMETTFLGDEAIAMAEMRGQWLECQAP
ncbi:MAG: thermonuclease family protein [Sandaracinaceae bacterium]|nr:thermonuclease family protein [Sandaracinaceae bacterium]